MKDINSKLKMKSKRLFLRDGKEVLTTDMLRESLCQGCTLLASQGEGFVGDTTAQTIRPAPSTSVKVSVFAEKSHVDDNAIKQLEGVASTMQGLAVAVALPDLHAGSRFPIGAAFAGNRIFPALIGGDIGCGMAVFATNVKAEKAMPSKWVSLLRGNMEGEWRKGDIGEFLRSYDIDPSIYPEHNTALGTIGGGNHFAEMQQFSHILLPDVVASLGLSVHNLLLVVHSGSRGLGQEILKDVGDASVSYEASSAEGQAYMLKHDFACQWAQCSRALIARRFCEALDITCTRSLDITHNSVESKRFEAHGDLWLHRKGAAPGDKGVVVIPGSRGARTYLVRPKEDLEKSAFSLAHGAGRQWTRTKAARIGKERFPKALPLLTPPNGNTVVCEDKELLYEEQPDAYKSIEAVIEDMVDMGLVDVVAVMTPVLTYKCQTPQHDGDD